AVCAPDPVGVELPAHARQPPVALGPPGAGTGPLRFPLPSLRVAGGTTALVTLTGRSAFHGAGQVPAASSVRPAPESTKNLPVQSQFLSSKSARPTVCRATGTVSAGSP